MTYVRPSILFVDDEVNVLNALKRSLRLQASHWDLAFEPDPREAIAKVRHTPVDVIVSDLDMPHLNGIEMIRAMRAYQPDAHYILLTGTGDFSTAIGAINEAHVFRFFTKPCALGQLTGAIQEILQKTTKTGNLPNRQESRCEGDAAFQLGLAHSALELITPAILVVEANGRLIYANKSAARLLGERDGFWVDGVDQCRCACPKATREFLTLLEKHAFEPSAQPAFLSLPRPSMKRDLSLVLVPLSATNDQGQHLIAVLLTDPEGAMIHGIEGLKNLFGLSASEAVIAQVIAQGAGLEKAASASGLTLSSARTYLKRIYAKTGANGQADLVKLILSSPAALLSGRNDQASVHPNS